MAALWAGTAQRLPQKEVKNNAQGVGNNNGHNRPKCRAHPSAFCVAVDIADEQQIAATANSGPKAHQRSPPRRWSMRVASHHNVEENLGGDKYDHRQRPCPRRNNPDFRSESSLSFVFYLHKCVRLVPATTATA